MFLLSRFCIISCQNVRCIWLAPRFGMTFIEPFLIDFSINLRWFYLIALWLGGLWVVTLKRHYANKFSQWMNECIIAFANCGLGFHALGLTLQGPRRSINSSLRWLTAMAYCDGSLRWLTAMAHRNGYALWSAFGLQLGDKADPSLVSIQIGLMTGSRPQQLRQQRIIFKHTYPFFRVTGDHVTSVFSFHPPLFSLLCQQLQRLLR